MYWGRTYHRHTDSKINIGTAKFCFSFSFLCSIDLSLYRIDSSKHGINSSKCLCLCLFDSHFWYLGSLSLSFFVFYSFALKRKKERNLSVYQTRSIEIEQETKAKKQKERQIIQDKVVTLNVLLSSARLFPCQEILSDMQTYFLHCFNLNF